MLKLPDPDMSVLDILHRNYLHSAPSLHILVRLKIGRPEFEWIIGIYRDCHHFLYQNGYSEDIPHVYTVILPKQDMP